MNERIKKLAEQCWDRRLDGLHFDQEQFAELIVEECANWINELMAELTNRYGAQNERTNY